MRNCIVVCNLANITGTLNHGIKASDGSYGKLRTDYKELLNYLVGPDRTLIKAFVVSQQDISNNSKSLEQLQNQQKFVQRLSNFGWTPLRVSYNRESGDMAPVLDAIWENIAASITDAEDKFTVNPSLTDIVFVNGSSAWYELIAGFFTKGFSVEVAYPKIATSKLLMANFAFFDITPFLMSSNAKLLEHTRDQGNNG